MTMVLTTYHCGNIEVSKYLHVRKHGVTVETPCPAGPPHHHQQRQAEPHLCLPSSRATGNSIRNQTEETFSEMSRSPGARAEGWFQIKGDQRR